ncbi:MAG TPA: 50S ribosomal protein L21 [Bacteroidota bacterium]|nr:50S ribosomal protein L21 [Bacteroidota bacterium]
MYAVVEISGTQVKVSPSSKVFVPKLISDAGATVKFDKVLVKGDDTQTTVGAPYIAGSSVEAKVLRHVKDDTVIVLKKKKRKGYHVRNGHRQQYSEIEITNVK